jgi:hypothetical protein
MLYAAVMGGFYIHHSKFAWIFNSLQLMQRVMSMLAFRALNLNQNLASAGTRMTAARQILGNAWLQSRRLKVLLPCVIRHSPMRRDSTHATLPLFSLVLLPFPHRLLLHRLH